MPLHSIAICIEGGVFALHSANLFLSAGERLRRRQGGQGECEGDEEPTQLVPHPPCNYVSPALRSADSMHRIAKYYIILTKQKNLL